jgi:hypothetical protein
VASLILRAERALAGVMADLDNIAGPEYDA